MYAGPITGHGAHGGGDPLLSADGSDDERALGHTLSAQTIERLVDQVGAELGAKQATSHAEQEVVVPTVALVSCDGGRIQTRKTGHGPGVHGAQWRETKNSLFERMQAADRHPVDPCPALPDTFRHIAHVANITETPAFHSGPPVSNGMVYRDPKRILRTCLSSMVCSREFGGQMQREATRRRFFEASSRVFIGDGLPWNWTIWREHFPTFTPILAFIHAVQYLYAAAQAWEATDA